MYEPFVMSFDAIRDKKIKPYHLSSNTISLERFEEMKSSDRSYVCIGIVVLLIILVVGFSKCEN